MLYAIQEDLARFGRVLVALRFTYSKTAIMEKTGEWGCFRRRGWCEGGSEMSSRASPIRLTSWTAVVVLRRQWGGGTTMESIGERELRERAGREGVWAAKRVHKTALGLF